MKRLLITLVASWLVAAAALAGDVQTTFDPSARDDSTRGFTYSDRWYNTASGNEFVYVGTVPGVGIWRHVPRVLAANGAQFTFPANDTAENIGVSLALPGGSLGANGSLRITFDWGYTNSANTKNMRVRLSGLAGTQIINAAGTTQTAAFGLAVVQNRNASNAQASRSTWTTNGGGLLASATTTSAIATDADTTLVITGQKATGSETLTLEGYSIELIRPDIR